MAAHSKTLMTVPHSCARVDLVESVEDEGWRADGGSRREESGRKVTIRTRGRKRLWRAETRMDDFTIVEHACLRRLAEAKSRRMRLVMVWRCSTIYRIAVPTAAPPPTCTHPRQCGADVLATDHRPACTRSCYRRTSSCIIAGPSLASTLSSLRVCARASAAVRPIDCDLFLGHTRCPGSRHRIQYLYTIRTRWDPQPCAVSYGMWPGLVHTSVVLTRPMLGLARWCETSEDRTSDGIFPCLDEMLSSRQRRRLLRLSAWPRIEDERRSSLLLSTFFSVFCSSQTSQLRHAGSLSLSYPPSSHHPSALRWPFRGMQRRDRASDTDSKSVSTPGSPGCRKKPHRPIADHGTTLIGLQLEVSTYVPLHLTSPLHILLHTWAHPMSSPLAR
nr:hypothetical protein CFP56_11818 [Quercus suber]